MNQQTNHRKSNHSYMQRRLEEHTPPPSLQEIRRQLGWGITGAVRPVSITTLRTDALDARFVDIWKLP